MVVSFLGFFIRSYRKRAVFLTYTEKKGRVSIGNSQDTCEENTVLTMLVRNRVEDYQRWISVFDTQDQAANEAGLHLTNLWRDVEDPNNVFFVLRVSDLDKARAFLADPRSAEVGKEAGVIDGEVHFLESVEKMSG